MSQESNSNDNLCPVCYQEMLYPITLTCNHTFCFLCAKGAFSVSQACPLCRTRIQKEIIHKPDVNPDDLNVQIAQNQTNSSGVMTRSRASNNHITWFYESNRSSNSWWKYDARTTAELEEKYQEYLKNQNTYDHQKFEILIAGNMYVIDFVLQVQYQKSGIGRRRAIRRSHTQNNSEYVKGTAGIYVYDRS